MNEYITPENIKFAGPIVAAIIAFFTALITFILTSAFTMWRERKKNHIENRAYFDYSEFGLRYPIGPDKLKVHGEGILLYGQNGNKYKNLPSGETALCSFMIIKNVTKNDLLNVRIRSVYTGSSKIEEEFVLPFWKHDDTLYLFQSDFNSNSHFSTNDELLIEFTTKSYERLRFQYLRQKNKTYKEVYEKSFLKYWWRNLLTYNKSSFFTIEKLKKKEDRE